MGMEGFAGSWVFKEQGLLGAGFAVELLVQLCRMGDHSQSILRHSCVCGFYLLER